MGMYDTIKEELFCPFCGAKQKSNDFQTKDFNCSLASLEITKIRGINYNIYMQCFNCNNWIELCIGECSHIHTLKEGQKQIEKRRKELAKLFGKVKKKKPKKPSVREK